VLLPVRDGLPWLDACLDSLAAQTLGEHEVVAVDDGSRDGSGERLAERARRDPRLRLRRTPPRGLVSALQLALEQARAPVVARMDADDVAHPERLARQLERLEREPALDVLGCGVEVPSGGPHASRGMRAYVDWTNGLLDHDAILRERFVESPLVHPSVALRTASLRRLGGWRDGAGPEDYELWLRAVDAGLRFAKLPQVLLQWRDTPGRLTRTDPRYAPARFLATKLEALARGPLAGRPAAVWGSGPIGKSWSRALRAAGQRVVAFVEVDPRKIGTRIHDVPVLGLDEAATVTGALHLGAVGQPGARQRLRAEAARLGLEDGRDFFAVA
jgi:cellulose synthase/poly-beta-1,6-N-acetylglucosamine synthase-like glycosyltransferase